MGMAWAGVCSGRAYTEITEDAEVIEKNGGEARRGTELGGIGGSVVQELAVGVAAGDAALLGGELQGLFAVEFGLADQFFDARGEGLGSVGVGARRSGFGRADEQSDFAFGGMIAEKLHQIEEFAAAKFFVKLGDFARKAGGAIAENGEGVSDGIGDAVRRFVENHGALFDAEVFEGAAAFATARGKKSHKKKFLVRQAGGGKRGEQRRRAGNRHDGNVVANGQGDEAMTGVTDQGHARIADESDGRAVFHGQDEFGGAGELVVFVIADQGLVNVVVIQKLQGVARIFAGDVVHLLEDAEGAEGDVLQVADGRGYQIEAALARGFGMGALGHEMCCIRV